MKKFAQWNLLSPLDELDGNDLELLYDDAEIRKLDPRTLITAEKDELIYLLEGEASLLSGGFVTETFTHLQLRARLPLFNESLEEDSAVLTSHGTILVVKKEMFEGLLSQARARNGNVSLEGLTDAENKLYRSLLMALNYKKLELPGLPETAFQIRHAISQPEVGSQEIIQIVQNDPVLSARLIKVANSPLYGTWREIKSVRDAVRRLGLETTKNLSFSLSVKKLFSAKTSIIKDKIHEIYNESLSVAAIAYVITQNRVPQLDPEQALLAGLVQNLGLIPILKYIDEHPSMMESIEMLGKSMANLKIPVSTLIFGEWNFDPVFLEIVEQAENWGRNSGEEIDYCDILIAARLLFLQNQDCSPVEELDQVPVINKLKLLEHDDDGQFFMDKATDEINEMQRLLNTV